MNLQSKNVTIGGYTPQIYSRARAVRLRETVKNEVLANPRKLASSRNVTLASDAAKANHRGGTGGLTFPQII